MCISGKNGRDGRVWPVSHEADLPRRRLGGHWASQTTARRILPLNSGNNVALPLQLAAPTAPGGMRATQPTAAGTTNFADRFEMPSSTDLSARPNPLQSSSHRRRGLPPTPYKVSIAEKRSASRCVRSASTPGSTKVRVFAGTSRWPAKHREIAPASATPTPVSRRQSRASESHGSDANPPCSTLRFNRRCSITPSCPRPLGHVAVSRSTSSTTAPSSSKVFSF